MSDEIQDAATADAIQRWVDTGSELSRPMTVDFFVALPDEERGRAFVPLAKGLGFATSLELDGTRDAWTCYCTRTLVPSFEAIRAVEKQLDALARPLGGRADGFGSFGNAPEPAGRG